MSEGYVPSGLSSKTAHADVNQCCYSPSLGPALNGLAVLRNSGLSQLNAKPFKKLVLARSKFALLYGTSTIAQVLKPVWERGLKYQSAEGGSLQLCLGSALAAQKLHLQRIPFIARRVRPLRFVFYLTLVIIRHADISDRNKCILCFL